MLNDPRPQHFDVIDGLRAVAVLSVVLYHLDKLCFQADSSASTSFSRFRLRRQPVDVEVPGGDFWPFMAEFYARRLLRIAPGADRLPGRQLPVATCLFTPQAWLSHANQPTALAAFVGLSNFVLARSWNNYSAPLAEFNPFTTPGRSASRNSSTWPSRSSSTSCTAAGMAGRHGAVPARLRRPSSPRHLRLVDCQGIPALGLLPATPRFWELAAGILVFEAPTRWKAPLHRQVAGGS